MMELPPILEEMSSSTPPSQAPDGVPTPFGQELVSICNNASPTVQPTERFALLPLPLPLSNIDVSQGDDGSGAATGPTSTDEGAQTPKSNTLLPPPKKMAIHIFNLHSWQWYNVFTKFSLLKASLQNQVWPKPKNGKIQLKQSESGWLNVCLQVPPPSPAHFFICFH